MSSSPTTAHRAPAARYTFTLRPNLAVQLRDETVTQALQTIERRVNELGVAEPVVARHSAADQILVQLPGVTDVDRAKEIIRSTAILELKLVEQGPFGSEEQALQAYANNLPPELQILPGNSEGVQGDRPSTVYYVVRRIAAVTGRDLRNARPTLDENNRPAVSFTLNNEGAQKFGAFTQANIGRQLAIVLDNRVYSAPRIEGRIDDRRTDLRQLHAAGGGGSLADVAVRRAAGGARPTWKSGRSVLRSAQSRFARASSPR